MPDEDGIVRELTPLLADCTQHRQPREQFGAFVIRQGYVQLMESGLTFHE
jgi:sulfite reductase (NADPH) hemoprotein beta-component